MSDSLTVSEANRELARQINQVADHPQSAFAGKFVGISGGRIVAVADDLDELVRPSAPGRGLPPPVAFIEVGLDYGQVQEIWGVH